MQILLAGMEMDHGRGSMTGVYLLIILFFIALLICERVNGDE